MCEVQPEDLQCASVSPKSACRLADSQGSFHFPPVPPMKTPSSRFFQRLAAALCVAASAGSAMAQDFRVSAVQLRPDGRLEVSVPAMPGSYHRLLHGNEVTGVSLPVELSLGGTLATRSPVAGQSGFYRVQRVPVDAPLDSDLDGLPDPWELARAPALDGLNAADAATDPDGNGRTFLQEFQGEVVVPFGIEMTSPANGDNGVSVNRKTEFELTGPLAGDAMVDTTQLFAEYGGRRLLARTEISADRRTVSLLYQEPLPAGARVRVSLLGTGLKGANGRDIDGDADGQPGGTRTIYFDTFNAVPVAQTAVIGHVYASEPVPGPEPGSFVNRPLVGVTVTVDGAEETLRTTTDAQGFFKLKPAPVGRFFVHVDGRTAVGSQWPAGDYYPVVGKAWEAVAGREDTLAAGTGEIFLPLIRQGTLQPVSATEVTTIKLPPAAVQENPALAEVQLLVPANALFSNNGARGGQVGMAPVPPDRLPEPLPPGLNLPLVITVQTDGGLNFDQPAPVRFPNLPDPETGVRLPPGAKSALWSFNHEKGKWEIVGPMTVTADGRYVESDPGVGIRQPGWHGSAPGANGRCDRIRDGGGRGGPDGGGGPGGGGPGGGGPGGGGVDGDGDGDGQPDGPPCDGAEGSPCDDGDPCTENDRCVGGRCIGTPITGAPCGPNRVTAIDYSRWTYTAAAAGGNFASPSGFEYDGAVCYLRGSRNWAYRVSAMRSLGNINLTISGSIEPNPVVGGNVTRANYCDMIASMVNYSSERGGRGPYHLLAASRAHEEYHRDVDLPRFINPLWTAAELAIEAETVACDVPAATAAVRLRNRANRHFRAMFNSWLAVWSPWVRAHNAQTTDGAYQAGQAVLNRMIQRVRDFAADQGWPACPRRLGPGEVLPRIGRHHGGAHGALTGLTATISQTLLDPGQNAGITVTGHFEDGTTLDLTGGALGTEYLPLADGIVTVNANGLVTAVAPGTAFILATHQEGLDMHPLAALVEVTVRLPEDRDNDGLPDAWETANGLNPAEPTDAASDLDGDGVENYKEFESGTDPRNRDSDGDGLSDHEELLQGTDPTRPTTGLPVPSTGLHYFALMNLETGRIEQRGPTGRNGEGHDSLIMAPNAHYRQWVLRAADLAIGTSEWLTPDSGQTFDLPAVSLRPDAGLDSDNDGLSDVAEMVMGTKPGTRDSDGDGVPDGAEVRQGTDPTDGLPVRTGVIGSGDTAGIAVDVAAENNVAVVADRNAGVALFDVQNGFSPTRIAQLDTPGDAMAVALAGDTAVAADGHSGLAVFALRDLSNPRLVRQVNVGGGFAQAVTLRGGLAFVGSDQGQLAVVNLTTGDILDRLQLGVAIHDLGVNGDTLFVLTYSEMRTFALGEGTPVQRGSIPLTQSLPEGITGKHRLFVGTTRAFVTSYPGYDVFDISDPANLRKLGSATDVGPNSFKQIVDNGSGLGVAAVGVNPRDDGTHDVWLYNVTDPAQTTRLITTLATPGIGHALALYNGLAYVADGAAGLQVVNYLAYDTAGVAPTITLGADFPLSPGRAEEGKLVQVSANVSDDVQVARVEFYVDGRRITTDGNFPFVTRFVTPSRAGGRTSFLLRAKAVDTGGNETWSAEHTIELVADATPPRVFRTIPANGGGAAELRSVSVFFSEPMDPARFLPANLAFAGSGVDGEFGTPDDVPVNWPAVFDGTQNLLQLEGAASLPAGSYRLTLGTGLTDLAGNSLPAAVRLNFSVGFGLSAEYFDNQDFTALRVLRVDPVIDFEWGGGSPDPAIGPDQFSVRWRGSVTPTVSGEHTFTTVSDDGIRLWVDRQLVVDEWNDHGPTEHSGRIILEAGRRYDLRMEMYENGGGATARLFWSAPGLDREIIPAGHFVPWEDTEGPRPVLVDAENEVSGRIRVQFSEPVDPVSAGTARNYVLDGGATVTQAELLDDNLTVLLRAVSLAEATDYRLTIAGVRDLSAGRNPVPAGTVVCFRSPRTIEGALRRDLYFNLNGALLADLINSPRYPHHPDRSELVPSAEVPENTAEQFGQRLAGWITPPVTGSYQFYFSSDDQGALWLGTDETPASATQIASEPSWSSARSWLSGGVSRDPANPQNISRPVSLEAGRRYYLEAAAKEAGGGDHVGINWRHVPEVGAGAFVIEAEDFDHHGGQHEPRASVMPYTGGAYAGFSATPDVDYFRVGDPSDVYRLGEEPNVAIAPVEHDRNRGTWEVVNDFFVGWNDAGEWMNYTRTFPAGTYNVYGRLSSGGAAISARLEEVVIGRGTTTQQLTRLGEFNAPNTGGWGVYTYVPLRDDTGGPAAVSLAGERTLRFTVQPGNLDLNYLLLVPAPANFAALRDVPLTPPPSGTPPIAGRYLSTRITDDGSGHLRRDYFPGNFADLAALRASPAFPDRPESSELIGSAEVPQVPVAQFAQRLTAWLCPPVTGDYRFFLAADNQAELWLSTDADPANRRRLAYEPEWSGSREYRGNARGTRLDRENASAPVRLEAGRSYFFDLVHADQGNGNHVAVAWQMPGDYEPGNGHPPIPGRYFRAFDGPGVPRLLAPPLTQTIREELAATFRAHVVGLAPFSFQWFYQGEPITGATGATHSIPFLRKADEGAYTVRVRNFLGEVTSEAGRLTVTQDETPPTLVRAEGSGSMERVRLTFSEELDPTTAQSTGNYSVSGGLTVHAANLLADKKTVVIHTSRQAEDTAFTVTVSGVRDDAPLANVIAAGATAEFTSWHQAAGVLNREAYFNIGGSPALVDLTAHPRFLKAPDEEGTVPLFETPLGVADNYGVRLSGWITPPVTGDYRFFLATDDQGALFLSTDETPANRRQIAAEGSWRGHRTWLTDRNPDEAQSALILLEAGRRYWVEALMKEAAGGDNLAVTWQLVSATKPTFIIEAEDFNTGGGQHRPEASVMPYLGGAYNGLSAVAEVDFNDPGAPESITYRTSDQGVGVNPLGSDLARGSWTVTADFRTGWSDPGDWMNYTRNFPAGEYYVLARASSGGNPIRASLDEVTAGAATAEQTLVPLGTFEAPNTGGWDTFTFVPLRTADGQLARVTLAGERTLRYTVGDGNVDLNYLALIPTAGAVLAPEGIAGTLPPANGSEPIGSAYLSGYVPPMPPPDPDPDPPDPTAKARPAATAGGSP